MREVKVLNPSGLEMTIEVQDGDEIPAGHVEVVEEKAAKAPANKARAARNKS